MDILNKAARASSEVLYPMYHLTKKSKVASILNEGLRPDLGDNSSKVDEQDKGVYLCVKEHIKYWQILIDCDALIEEKCIMTHDCECRRYHPYDEYIYKGIIPGVYCKEVELPPIDGDAMRELCLRYINALSAACTTAARYYEGNTSIEEEYLDGLLIISLAVENKLDYSYLTTEEKKKYLTDLGEEGDYTFLDAYKDTGRKLYEQLIHYPDDSTKDKRVRLYEYIKRVFSDCLDLDTGGWTG